VGVATCIGVGVGVDTAGIALGSTAVGITRIVGLGIKANVGVGGCLLLVTSSPSLMLR